MVHALREIWRVLAARGTLLDLRPLSAHCPVEAIGPDRLHRIGEIDATGMAADDEAADRAMRDVVEEGRFVPRREARFEFEFYWDTIPDMTSFIASSRRLKLLVPSSADLQAAYQTLSAQERGGIRLRCRRPTLLAVYDKGVS